MYPKKTGLSPTKLLVRMVRTIPRIDEDTHQKMLDEHRCTAQSIDLDKLMVLPAIIHSLKTNQ